MDCEHVIELLPWYLNHSLKPDERQEVEQHLSDCHSCRQELGGTSATGVTFGQHVPSKELVDYVFEQPGNGVSRERITKHLESCEDCRSELAMIHDSRSALSRADGVMTSRYSWSDWAWRWVAAAASLACIVTAGGWRLTWQTLAESRAEPEPLVAIEIARTAQVNIPVVHLDNLVRRSGDIYSISGDLESTLFILVPCTEPKEGDNMKLELVHGDGSIEELGDQKPVLSKEQDYTVLLPTGRLQSGSYQLRISGELNGERKVIGEFPFRVDRPTE
jgi:hypothetical protein